MPVENMSTFKVKDIEKEGLKKLAPIGQKMAERMQQKVNKRTHGYENSITSEVTDQYMKVGASGKHARLTHLLEYGTVERKKKTKTGKTVSTGTMEKAPFFRTTIREFEDELDAAVEAMLLESVVLE